MRTKNGKKTRNHACENSHLSLLRTTSDVSSGYTRCVKWKWAMSSKTHGTCRSCLSSLLFLPHQEERWLHFPNYLAVFITDCKRFGLPCRSSGFALVCCMIAILISIFKKYLKNADPFCIYIQRDQFASEMPHAAKTVLAMSKTFLLLLWYALILTALLL